MTFAAFGALSWLVLGLTFGGKLGQYTYWWLRDVHVTAFDRYWGTLFMTMGFVELLALASIISIIAGALIGGVILRRAGFIALLLALAAWMLLIPRIEHWASGHPIVNPWF